MHRAMYTGCCVVALAIAPSAVPAQAQANPAVQRAAQLLGANRAAEAVPILDSLTQADPSIPPGWGLLGAALLSTRQLERAVPVLERAMTFPGPRANALYNLGLAHGLLGNLDSAFTLLHAAKATGRIDLTRLAFDPDAGPIRADTRVRGLLPSEAEYAAPFVEPVRILAEWRGDQAGDQFGWIARNAGDVDGDGVADVVTSAPTAGNGAGAVYLLSTAKRARIWSVRGAGADELGFGIEAAGDVNRDGVPDVIAGAPGAGYALLLSGRDGSVLRRITGRDATERFGERVSGLGDINGDGAPEVLISAPQSAARGARSGRVAIHSSATGAELHAWQGEAGHQLGQALAGATTGGGFLVIAGAPGAGGGGRSHVWTTLQAAPRFTLVPDSSAVQFGGMFASVVGDVDRDGVPDLYVSDWTDRARGSTTGRAYVYSGASGARLLALGGEGAGNGYGIGSAEAGDVDRDGHDDLIIGAWQFNGAAPAGGKLYLHSGADGRLLGALTGRVMGETLGFDATGLGDVNGDGVPDLLVTSAWSAANGVRSGRVLVLSGAEVLAGGKPAP